MDKIKVIITKDWAGGPDGETPVLLFQLPFPDFGEKGMPSRILEITKRTMLGPVAGMAKALTFLPASVRVPGFSMEMCQADVMTWHEVVNAVHEAQALMVGIDSIFVPGSLVEQDDLCNDAIADALGVDLFELTIAQSCESFWCKSVPSPCAGCPNEDSCEIKS